MEHWILLVYLSAMAYSASIRYGTIYPTRQEKVYPLYQYFMPPQTISMQRNYGRAQKLAFTDHFVSLMNFFDSSGDFSSSSSEERSYETPTELEVLVVSLDDATDLDNTHPPKCEPKPSSDSSFDPSTEESQILSEGTTVMVTEHTSEVMTAAPDKEPAMLEKDSKENEIVPIDIRLNKRKGFEAEKRVLENDLLLDEILDSTADGDEEENKRVQRRAALLDEVI